MIVMLNASEKITVQPNTEFQIYKNYLRFMQNVVDFTEKRLLKMAVNLKDKNKKQQAYELITLYKDGRIAIAWLHGQPVYKFIING